MGMFDSFYIKRFRCPQCNKYYKSVDFQTKDLDCNLYSYNLYDKVKGFQNRDGYHYYDKGIVQLFSYCLKKDGMDRDHGGCGKRWFYFGVIREGRFIGIINSEGIKNWEESWLKLWRKYLKWDKNNKGGNKKK